MGKKFEGLLLTERIRQDLHLSVEEAIRCHVSALERDLKSREKEAREERIHMYDDTAQTCEDMLETRAMDILFEKYNETELIETYKKWLDKKELNKKE